MPRAIPDLLTSCSILLISISGLALLLAPAPPIGISAQTRPIVIDNVRAIDGTGSVPIEKARIVVQDGRIVQIGPIEQVQVPDGAETVDLSGKTVMPGLIDLHFHIENDPKLALRQLSNGVTAFRDPGQWNEKFVELKKTIASAGLPGPRIFTTGPHIDGERPAYPADSVVARDAEEARRLAERNIREGGSAVKIYFRLPFNSARAVIDVCQLRQVPCTAHLEILDARELISAGLHGIEHITSFGVSLLPRMEAEAYRQAVLADNDARRDGRYKMFAGIDLNGPEAQALYSVLSVRKPWIDATLAVFERRPPLPLRGSGATGPRTPRGSGGTGASRDTKPEIVAMQVAGFAKMKELTRRAAMEGARVVMGGHSSVPFAERGEAPWRELELLVESGFSPLEAIAAGTSTAAAFLYKAKELGSLQPGFQADIIVLRDNPATNIAAIRSVERVMVAGRWIDVAQYRGF